MVRYLGTAKRGKVLLRYPAARVLLEEERFYLGKGICDQARGCAVCRRSIPCRVQVFLGAVPGRRTLLRTGSSYGTQVVRTGHGAVNVKRLAFRDALYLALYVLLHCSYLGGKESPPRADLH